MPIDMAKCFLFIVIYSYYVWYVWTYTCICQTSLHIIFFFYILQKIMEIIYTRVTVIIIIIIIINFYSL